MKGITSRDARTRHLRAPVEKGTPEVDDLRKRSERRDARRRVTAR